MARRLPRWHWIRAVRAHGPRVPAICSVLYALAVRMDESGEAYPSQRTIAADTALGERTVRDAILEARRAAWIAVVDHVRPGQAWRRSHYIACIPDSLNLSEVDLGRDVDLEAMADAIGSQHGDIADQMHGLPRRVRGAAPRKAKGAATIAARSKAQKGEGAANGGVKVRQRVQEGAATIAENVRQPSPTKFPSEVPIKTLREGHVAGDATARVKDAQVKKPEPGTQPHPMAVSLNGSDPVAMAPEVLQEAKKPEPEPKRDLTPDIRKLIESGQTPADVLKILGKRGVTMQDVREAMT